jgi:hypothetical protein
VGITANGDTASVAEPTSGVQHPFATDSRSYSVNEIKVEVRDDDG